MKCKCSALFYHVRCGLCQMPEMLKSVFTQPEANTITMGNAALRHSTSGLLPALHLKPQGIEMSKTLGFVAILAG